MDETKAPQYLKKEVFKDCDIILSGHKWPTR